MLLASGRHRAVSHRLLRQHERCATAGRDPAHPQPIRVSGIEGTCLDGLHLAQVHPCAYRTVLVRPLTIAGGFPGSAPIANQSRRPGRLDPVVIEGTAETTLRLLRHQRCYESDATVERDGARRTDTILVTRFVRHSHAPSLSTPWRHTARLFRPRNHDPPERRTIALAQDDLSS